MTSLMPRHTVSSGCSCGGAALSTASARIKVSSWSGKIASSLERKWRKKVRRATPAAAAISSAVVASYPLVANSSIAAAASSRRILSRWAAARLPAALSGASGVAGVREDLAGWDMTRTYCMCAACCACTGFPRPVRAGERRVRGPGDDCPGRAARPSPSRLRTSRRRAQRRAYSRKPRPVLRPRQPAATRCSRSGAGARPGSRNSRCRTFSIARETSSPTTSRSSKGPIG